MPKATKSAKYAGTCKADVHTLLSGINTDSTASMFNADTTLANPYLTLEFASWHCHTNKTRGWAAQNGSLIYGNQSGRSPGLKKSGLTNSPLFRYRSLRHYVCGLQ